VEYIAETVRGIDVERGASEELHRISGLKLVKLLKESLPNIGYRHFSSEPDFHFVLCVKYNLQ
jgi:hypothetical protein